MKPTRSIQSILSQSKLKQWNQITNAFISLSNNTNYKIDLDENCNDLKGLSIAIKDNICTKDFPTTAASKMLEGFNSGYNATAVQKLINKGVIIMGKTNMDEFGMGSNNVNSYFGSVKNPHPSLQSEAFSPGGSSGGSAAAVASSQCYGALGSDTGGSIRLPAAYCGIIGLKPSYGAVSRYGLIPYASSLDTIGVLARDFKATRLIFNAIKGLDLKDPTTIELNDNKQFEGWNSIKIGVPKEYYLKELEEDALMAWKFALKKLQEAGATLVPISLSSTRYSLPAYYIIALAEASSNLNKYDGIEYGYRSNKETTLLEQVKQSRHEAFGKEVQRRILLGCHVLSEGSIKDYFNKANEIRNWVKHDFAKTFKQVDILLTPTSYSKAPSFNQLRNVSILHSYLNDVFTVPSSLAGCPAINIPFYKQNKEKSPIGIQLIGKIGDDNNLIDLAEEVYKII